MSDDIVCTCDFGKFCDGDGEIVCKGCGADNQCTCPCGGTTRCVGAGCDACMPPPTSADFDWMGEP